MWLKEHSEHHSYTLRPHADPQFLYFPIWLQSLKEVPLWKSELPVSPRARKLIWGGVKLLTRVQVRVGAHPNPNLTLTLT